MTCHARALGAQRRPDVCKGEGGYLILAMRVGTVSGVELSISITIPPTSPNCDTASHRIDNNSDRENWSHAFTPFGPKASLHHAGAAPASSPPLDARLSFMTLLDPGSPERSQLERRRLAHSFRAAKNTTQVPS